MMESLSRSRLSYALLIIAVIVLGLASRAKSLQPFLPSFISEYAGDTLYAVMIYFGLAFLRPRASTLTLAVWAFGICVLIELSQLYHAAWIDSLRQTRIGGLVLGFGFLWSDVLCYTVGIFSSAALVWWFKRFSA
jgi:Protein of unknown function (DUF2809)